MAVLRLFAAARTAAGTARATTSGATVAEVLDDAVARYGEDFAAVLTTCAVWVDGEPATGDTPVTDAGEVAVLPPVSGGRPGWTPSRCGPDPGTDVARLARPDRPAAPGRPDRPGARHVPVEPSGTRNPARRPPTHPAPGGQRQPVRVESDVDR